MVGIAGGSGSGKTTFVKKVLNRIGPQKHTGLAILHQDSYYMTTPPEHLRVHGKPNFDHPDAFDWTLLKKHLNKLKQGLRIEVPVYDFKVSQRTQETEPIGPCQAVLVEGIFTLWDADIRSLFDVKIFLHVEADIRFIRRLHRDAKERGRSMDSIIGQYYDTVRPMHHEFIDPTRQFADIVVGEETDIAAEVLSAKVSQIL
ncbi:MAG: uridine kinase [Bdellovibrio sp.]|nr:uridine kinase [Bdellovibrio sp.]